MRSERLDARMVVASATETSRMSSPSDGRGEIPRVALDEVSTDPAALTTDALARVCTKRPRAGSAQMRIQPLSGRRGCALISMTWSRATTKLRPLPALMPRAGVGWWRVIGAGGRGRRPVRVVAASASKTGAFSLPRAFRVRRLHSAGSRRGRGSLRSVPRRRWPTRPAWMRRRASSLQRRPRG